MSFAAAATEPEVKAETQSLAQRFLLSGDGRGKIYFALQDARVCAGLDEPLSHCSDDSLLLS